MTQRHKIQLFEDKKVRTAWDDEREEWYFSIVDVCGVLTESKDPQAYWRKLKQRLKDEGNETVTNCHALKMRAADGKMRMTDVAADTEQMFRLIQSIPSKKAEPFKQWMASVAKQRLDQMADPELAIDQAIQDWRRKGYSENWINNRVKRYDIKGKSVFEQQDKYYFEDLGLRNYLCRDKRSLDIEKVLEGAVYLKLKRSGYDVYVGQLNGKEIDFVARRGDKVLYVQVAVQLTGEYTFVREFGNLKLIKDNYPKYVVTMDPNVGLIHDSGIVACSARQFLLNP